MTTEALRTSPLDAAHRALGAKLTEFGGWDMPLSYPAGTIAEHQACRTGGVVFDVSHLGTVRVEGADALARLQEAFTNDLGRIAPGKAQYTHLLDPARVRWLAVAWCAVSAAWHFEDGLPEPEVKSARMLAAARALL